MKITLQLDNITGEEVLAFSIHISNKIVAAGINLGVSQKAIDLINKKIVGKLVTWGIKQCVGINFITNLVATTVIL